MLIVDKTHNIKLLMFGSGLELVQTTLLREYPFMEFSYNFENDSDEKYIDSDDCELLKQIKSRMTSGDRLVIRRENKGCTQKDLSEKTGITIPTISLMEAGKPPIGIRTAEKFARALECDVSDFLHEEG